MRERLYGYWLASSHSIRNVAKPYVVPKRTDEQTTTSISTCKLSTQLGALSRLIIHGYYINLHGFMGSKD